MAEKQPSAHYGRQFESRLLSTDLRAISKLAHEHIYWDQASVLVQLGLLDSSKLPIAGIESARKVLDPKLPANEMIDRYK